MANRTIGTEIKLTGEKEFNQQMKAINSGLKTTKSDMAALSSEFEDNGNSMKALTQKQKLLESSVDQHKAKVEALKNQYQAAADAYGENSAMAQKYKQQLNQATVALNKETSALEKNSSALKDKYLSGLKAVASGAGSVFTGIGKGIGTAAAGVAKGVGAITAASAAGVAAIGAGGVIALTTMANMAREAADAAKAAHEAGETLTQSQQQWLAYSDQLSSLDSAVAGAKGALAGILLPMLGDLSAEGAAFLNDFTNDMTAAAGDTGKQTQILSDYIVKGATLIKQKLPEYIAAGKELFSGLSEGLSEHSDELLDMGLDLVYQLLDGIIENAPELAQAGTELVQKLLESMIERGPDVLASAIQMVAEITTGLAQAAPTMIPAAVQLVLQLVTALIENAPLLLEAGLELILGIVSGILNGLGDIGSSANAIIEKLVTAFNEGYQTVLDIGGDIVRGIWIGISAGTDWIYEKISGWVGNVLDWIKSKLGIASPSRLMRDEVGIWMARGIGVGFEREMANVNRQIASAIDTSFDVPDIYVGQSRYTGKNYKTAGGKVANLYITAKSLTEADISMLLDLVNRKLGDGI